MKKSTTDKVDIVPVQCHQASPETMADAGLVLEVEREVL
jgi:hypothetical protein